MNEDHVVEALVRRARDLGAFAHDVQVVGERAFPVLLAVVGQVQALAGGGNDGASGGHGYFLPALGPPSAAGRGRAGRQRPGTAPAGGGSLVKVKVREGVAAAAPAPESGHARRGPRVVTKGRF